VPALDTTQRWDRELSGDEQLTLAFVRVLLQAPPWILIDDTLRSLDGDTLERFMETLAQELQHTGVIHIGGGQARNPLFSRTLHLIKAPATHTVGRDDTAPAPPPTTDTGSTFGQ
jgi:putative ATP-binding cassette transporter